MFESYKLNKGEDLFSVANKFNTTVKTIQDLNRIYYLDDIRENMELIVPKEAKEYFNYYVVEKGDSLYAISRKYNINPELLASINGLKMDEYIYPNEQIIIPKSGYSYYITADDDTLDTVANVFKSNKEKVINENKNIYLLSGQLLVNKK